MEVYDVPHYSQLYYYSNIHIRTQASHTRAHGCTQAPHNITRNSYIASYIHTQCIHTQQLHTHAIHTSQLATNGVHIEVLYSNTVTFTYWRSGSFIISEWPGNCLTSYTLTKIHSLHTTNYAVYSYMFMQLLCVQLAICSYCV